MASDAQPFAPGTAAPPPPDAATAAERETQATAQVPCQVFSRVVGYLAAVSGWHAGKQQEFRERQMFVVDADKVARVEGHEIDKSASAAA